MVGVEMYAAGALLAVLDVIAYSHYREAKERAEGALSRLHLTRASRMREVLHAEVARPVADLAPEQLTEGRAALPAAPGEGAEGEDFDILLEEGDASKRNDVPGAAELADFDIEGELVFLPPSTEVVGGPLTPISAYPLAKPHAPQEAAAHNLEARLRGFEDFCTRAEAELSLLRQNYEALNDNIRTHSHDAPARGQASPAGQARPPVTLKLLKERRDRIERELKLLQNRYMKGNIDATSFQKLSTELHRELNKVHAQALELADKKG